jgi:hypothetical protein
MSYASSSIPVPVPMSMGGTGTTVMAPSVTIATLPAASANTGKFYIVTDALLPVLGVIVGGGGAVKVVVFSDGTSWFVA